MTSYQTEALIAAREIAHATEQLAETTAQELTPEVLQRLAGHAEMIERALSEFRRGCNQAAAEL